MNLPDSKKIGQALKAWREAQNKRAVEVAANSIKNGKKTVPTPKISTIENEGRGFSYDSLIKDVFPAYGIKDVSDFDIFLDSCADNSIETISVIRAKEDRSNIPGDGTKEILIPPQKLKGNRTRISIIEIDPGKRTIWQNHDGHEYVMIGKGKIRAEFAETKNPSPDKKTCWELNEGDGIAFSSAIYHSFINDSAEITQLIIARPTKSLPKGMQFKGYD